MITDFSILSNISEIIYFCIYLISKLFTGHKSAYDLYDVCSNFVNII